MKSFLADKLDEKALQEILDSHIDVADAEYVEVLVNTARNILWVNVNGVCLLRICRIKNLTIGDGK